MCSSIRKRPADDKDQGLLEIQGEKAEEGNRRPADDIAEQHKDNSELLTGRGLPLQTAQVKLLLQNALKKLLLYKLFPAILNQLFNHVLQRPAFMFPLVVTL